VERVAVPRDGEEREMPGFDVKVPSSARVWNYWVGGKDNFAADREAGEQILEAMPTLRAIAQMSRRFLIDAVHDLAAERGVRQFLDIGTGLPTADNTHDVAQRAAPDARIVYADYDPVVLTHAQALLTSTPEGKTDYIQADVRDPEVILQAARQTLDFSEPVAVILIFVMLRPGCRTSLRCCPEADGTAAAGQLSRHGSRRQRHRGGLHGGGCRRLQRSRFGADHAAGPCGGQSFLRRAGDGRPWRGAAGSMVRCLRRPRAAGLLWRRQEAVGLGQQNRGTAHWRP
jgi:hypothetical protein